WWATPGPPRGRVATQGLPPAGRGAIRPSSSVFSSVVPVNVRDDATSACQREGEACRDSETGGHRGEGLLPVAPRQEFQHEQPHAACEMRRQTYNDDPLAGDDERLLRPGKKLVE